MSPAAREPVAIVGLGCRFPGADSPAALWRLLQGSAEAPRDVPPDRASVDTRSKPVRFLSGIDLFDASFFRLSPREAERLDPQQRLLLECAWHALEDAGSIGAQAAAKRAGVFVGLWSNEYETRLFRDPAAADFHMTLGTGGYSASGRLSHFFGFRGPSLTVDTASSASLVAVHLACQSLHAGECDLALAGGANLILEPTITRAYGESGMLAPDGRCKFGDARADGYARSEGVGLVALKRLSAAIADGDRIYAVILGGAVNHDGDSGEFLATPGQGGQEDLLRRAWSDAGVAPADIQYVEAHGTGSRAGDPIELLALGAALSGARPHKEPCRVGSVKTNIGHAEAAAGVAGLIKVALSLHAGVIPASLHFESPNPDVPWGSLPLRVQVVAEPWQSGAPPIAGVSSFGIAGTNAHIVLQQWRESQPADESSPASESRAELLPLSSETAESLAEIERECADWLSSSGDRLADICFTAGDKRIHSAHRSAVVGASPAEVRDRLLGTSSEPGGAPARGVADAQRRKVVFVFPGQGSQWVGMGRQLYAGELAFRAELDILDTAIKASQGWSVIDVLHDDSLTGKGWDIDIVQPTLFAVEAALAALWRSWGIHPDAVVGHSMGEVAAAYVAGVLSVADAARIIGRRSALLKRLSGRGAMAVVELTIDEAAEAIRGHEDRVAIAVSNSRQSTVLSGDPAALDAIIERLEDREVFCRMVKVDVASHSPQMDALRGDLLAALAEVRPRKAAVPMYSTVLSGQLTGTECEAEYWVRNLRQPVQFSRAVEQLFADGHVSFIEMSPHPLLVADVRGLADGAVADSLVAAGSLRRNESERATLLGNLAQLYVRGHEVDWTTLRGRAGRVVSLPLHRWHRERFWYEPNAVARANATTRDRAATAAEQTPTSHIDLRTALIAAAPGRERRNALEHWIREELASVLRLPAKRVDATKPFRTLGLDSLLGLELRRRLEAGASITIPVTSIWNHSTVSRLAPFLAERMEIPLDSPVAAPAAAASPDDDDVLAALLSELERISDEDAAERLMRGGA